MLEASHKNKQEIRKQFLAIRKGLNTSRREEASIAALEDLKGFYKQDRPILSFASFGSEIDLWALNHYLMGERALLLPKVINEELEIYLVNDISKLEESALGVLEPNPKLCKQYPIENITLALLPGTVFDEMKNRLGYGKGFYDRFLKKIPNAHKIGIGFKEQLASLLPCEEHDQKMDDLLLY